MPKRRSFKLFALVPSLFVALFFACVEPPPKIAAIPQSGFSIRLHVFGASALDARRTIESVKQNNKQFAVVKEGGDGEVLLGLENDSPKCVAPTALCSFRIGLRIKDRNGKVVHASSTTVQASSDKCADLCAQALNNVAVKVVETAAGLLATNAPPSDDASVESLDAAAASDAPTPIEAGPAPTVSASASPKGKKQPPVKVEAPAKAAPAICAVAKGSQLPSEEAEKRAAQVEALKRLGVLDQEEYDCLRKGYLERL